MNTTGRYFLRRRESGAAIVESVICMLLICLVLFGLLQLFYAGVAQMVTDYASFRAARSAQVGFSDEIAALEGRYKAIPASGKMMEPYNLKNVSFSYGNSPYQMFLLEKRAIEDSLDDPRIEFSYEYWRENDNTTKTSLTNSIESGADRVKASNTFNKYPWNFPLAKFFTGSETINITSESELSNPSSLYLE